LEFFARSVYAFIELRAAAMVRPSGYVSASGLTKDILSAPPVHGSFAEGRWCVATEMREEQIVGSEQRERRMKRRFEIAEEVRYKMLYGQRIAETGSGKTLNISSGGVWFTTENMLTVGMPIEVTVSWPVLLHDSCPMKLMVYGCVIRSNEKGAAVAIERYEFRTQGSRAVHQPVIPTPVEIRLPS
jgi:hypothetical protein